MHQGAKPSVFEYARQNRSGNTLAEKVLWEAIRLKRLDGYKFRNQHPIGSYIVDFYCHSAKLAIEVDGGYHQAQEQREYDLDRENDIALNGIKIIRFTNEDVLNKLEQVLDSIRFNLKERATTTPLTPKGES